MRSQVKSIFIVIGLVAVGIVVAVFSFANQIQSSILSGNNAPSGVIDLNAVSLGSSLLAGNSGEILAATANSATGVILSADLTPIQDTTEIPIVSNVVATNPISTGTILPVTSTGIIVASSTDTGFAEVQPITVPVVLPEVVHESSAVEPKAVEVVTPPIVPDVLPIREVFTREAVTEEQIIRENLTTEKVVATPKTGNEWLYILFFSIVIAIGLKFVPKNN